MQLSRLGFGLSSIAGSGNFKHQDTLIKTAIANGITHFDVAPYYGSGDAETILGKILLSCPDSITITTKYGLTPLNIGNSYIRGLVRPIFKRLTILKKLTSKAISQSHQAKQVTFIKGSLTASIDVSLNKIGRNIDILLLHDLEETMASNDELIAELKSAMIAGKITFAGVSGLASTVESIFTNYSRFYKIAQLENSLTTSAIAQSFFKNKNNYIITHRAIQGGLLALTFLVNNKPSFKHELDNIVTQDTSTEGVLTQLLIEIALLENKHGTTLFSTTKPERIIATAKAINQPILTNTDQVDAIRKLFNEVFVHDPY